mgnify:CR=1 FL=1
MQLARLFEGFLENVAVEFIELVGVDAVAATGLTQYLVLVTQAQQLDVVETVHHRGHIVATEIDRLGCPQQALRRAGR